MPPAFKPSQSEPGIALDDFRIDDVREMAAMLAQLHDARSTLHITAPNGASLCATLLASDPPRHIITLKVEADEPALQAVIDGNEASLVTYLDSVQLRFDLQHLVLVRGPDRQVLNAAFPREMFRFQRRNAFRVKPLLRHAPLATMRHPGLPEMQLSLRILDISLLGCALFLPDDVPPLEPGVLMNGVQMELDADTRLSTSLRLHHISAFNQESGGSRLGCELVHPAGGAERMLQRYIDQTQKKRRLMALD